MPLLLLLIVEMAISVVATARNLVVNVAVTVVTVTDAVAVDDREASGFI